MKGSRGIQASVLTSGLQAAVVTGRKLVSNSDLNALLAQIERSDLQPVHRPVRRQLSELVLKPDILNVLATMRTEHLVVVHDAAASRIPWETMRVEDWVPALRVG